MTREYAVEVPARDIKPGDIVLGTFHKQTRTEIVETKLHPRLQGRRLLIDRDGRGWNVGNYQLIPIYKIA